MSTLTTLYLYSTTVVVVVLVLLNTQTRVYFYHQVLLTTQIQHPYFINYRSLPLTLQHETYMIQG